MKASIKSDRLLSNGLIEQYPPHEGCMDPQVSLGAFQRLMAHHLLDVKNRAPLLEQLMGKGMPKAVGALRKARPAHAGADLFRNPVGGKGPIVFQVKEHGPFGSLGPGIQHVGRERLQGLFGQGDYRRLVVLPIRQ